ncbi:MAG TPA: toll/interleukin-1 receptor domain-containing protein [Blastocatellia bacterium]|nr:toll/interleukin-1 receptor domain-containing protein [Blastocatellia bacterium]
MKDSSPKIFISYSHDSPQHRARVLELANRLRSEGLDCHIDQYETAPPEGWPNWMLNHIEAADFVLLICTETYYRRFRQKEPVGTGKGAKWEGAVITLTLYDSELINRKFIPVVFAASDRQFIPEILRGTTNYDLSLVYEYDNLYRRLTGQSTAKPELKPIIPKPKPAETPYLNVHQAMALIEAARYEEAQHVLERALQGETARNGTQHPNVADCLNLLGEVHYKQEHYREARDCFERALKIYEASDGGNPTDVPRCLVNLGAVLREQHHYALARTHLERALQLLTAQYGQHHIEVSSTLNALGNILYDEGRFAEAQAHYEQAQAIDATLPDQDPTDAAITLNNLGKTLHAQGQFSAAREHYQQARQICQELLGEEHPVTLEIQRNLERLPQ